MPVSRLTAMMIAANEVKIIRGTDRWEAWTVKGQSLHALMLSAPLDKKEELEDAISQLKADYGSELNA